MHFKQNHWYTIALVAFTIALAAYAYYHDFTGLVAGHQFSQREVADLGQRLDSLKIEEEQLKANIEGLHEDPVAVEAAIRSSKGFVRENETIYRIEDPRNTIQ